eukprot:52482-Chlamydomonas_euryale.AAC.1
MSGRVAPVGSPPSRPPSTSTSASSSSASNASTSCGQHRKCGSGTRSGKCGRVSARQNTPLRLGVPLGVRRIEKQSNKDWAQAGMLVLVDQTVGGEAAFGAHLDPFGEGLCC